MKKYFVAFFLLVALFSTPAYAVTDNDGLIQTLLSQIERLIGQLQQLLVREGSVGGPGIVISSPKPGSQIILPVTVSGYITGEKGWTSNEGEAGSVVLLDEKEKTVSDIAILKTTTDWLKLPTYFEATVGDREMMSHLGTKTGKLVFKSSAVADGDIQRVYQSPVKFGSITPRSVVSSNTQPTMSLKLFYIAPNDNGVNGEKVGCGDSVVSITRTIEKTTQPLTKAIQLLLAEKRINLGESGLTNSCIFSLSDLKIESVSVQDGVATIKLMGDFKSLGVCDDPRFTAQMTRTALQFPTVKTVDIYVNGIKLDSLLLGRGY